MSLTSPGWYERVVYPTLAMMKRLGMTTVFQDGGSSGRAGVIYTQGAATRDRNATKLALT